MQPSQFITVGSCVRTLFVLPDGNRKWFNGVVKKLHATENGYAECDVFYQEDRDLVKNSKLFDYDFENDESLDAWEFAHATERNYDMFWEIRNRLDNVEKKVKKKSSFSLFGLCFTSLVLVTMYGAAFMQLECSKDTSEWCDSLKQLLSQRFSYP